MTTSHDVIQASVAAHNRRADLTAQDIEPLARAAVGALLAVLAAWALIAWATPCDAGHQCAGLLLAPAHALRNSLRGTWLHRAWVWPRTVWLRARIHWAQDEVDEKEFMLRADSQLTSADRTHLLLQIKAHRLWIAERQIRLIGLDLATRPASRHSTRAGPQ